MSSTALTTLEPFSTLGMAGISGSGPHYINDASIVLPAGNQIIQQSLDTGERTFLFINRLTSNEPRNQEITAFSVSHDSTFLAIAATRLNVEPIINIYTIGRGTVYMSIPQPKANKIFFCTFHMKQKLLLVGVTYPRMNTLIVYDLQTKQEVKRVDTVQPFVSAMFNPDPNDSSIIFFTQNELFYVTSESKVAKKIETPNYSKFTGFVYSLNEKNVAIASSGRDMLFYQDFELSHTLTISEESPIILLATFNHGLIAATENYKVSLFQHISVPKDLGRSFQQGPVISYGINHPIVWASFSQSAHQMVCDVDHRQLILINIRELESNTENAVINPNIVSHKGPVIAISSCAYKPMLVSCGAVDRTVIVWDYSKQCSVLYREFTEDLKDVSFHPSGDLVAVASSDKLYLLTATVDSLVERARWPLFNCLSIQFSNGGHFLVAASHIITFINPYTQEIIATLRNHTGLINSLSWSPDDKRLVSSGSDGKIVVWNAVTQQKEWSVVCSKANFVSSVVSDRGTVVACSQKNVIYHLFNGKYQIRLSENDIGFSSILFASSTCIILGDMMGGVIVVPFPFIIPAKDQQQFQKVTQLEFSDGEEFKDNQKEIPFTAGLTFKAHCGKVTRLCSSLDSRVLFTSADDGSICVFNILNQSQSFAQSRIPILRCDIPREQFFLVPQSRYDELQHGIEKLKRDIQKQKVIYETETIEALQTHQKNLDELTRQHKEKKEKLNQQLASLREAMNDSTIKAALIYQNMEAAHMNEAKVLTNLYEQKLALERSKCDALSKEVEDLKCSYEERIYLLQQQYKSSLEDLGNKISSKQNQLQADLEMTNTNIQDADDKMRDRMIDLEVEFEQDRMQIDLDFHNKKIELKKLEEDLNKKVETLVTEIDKQTQLNTADSDKLQKLMQTRANLEKDIMAQQHTLECKKSELHDREETLNRQDTRLAQLQEQNNELLKYKELMNFRLDEMSKELQPNKDEINRLRGELDGTSEEIRTIKRVATSNHRTMQDKQHQIEVLKAKLADAQTALAKKRRVIQIFTIDLNEGVQRETFDEKMNVLKELHDKYVAVHDLEENIKDANDTINENTRQRKHLQESVMLLQKSVNQQKATTMKHFEAKSVENSQLLSDLNMLQKENRSLTKRLDLVQADVDMLQANLKRVQQAAREQQMKRTRLTHSALAPSSNRATGDWVKNNQVAQGKINGVSVADGRGKYLHAKG